MTKCSVIIYDYIRENILLRYTYNMQKNRFKLKL